MICECKTWTRCEPLDLQNLHDDLHHSHCPKFATEKRSRMFYFEESEDCWAPWPSVSCAGGDYVLTYLDCMDDGGQMEIQLRRRDMTDKEFSEVPDEDEWVTRLSASDTPEHHERRNK